MKNIRTYLINFLITAVPMLCFALPDFFSHYVFADIPNMGITDAEEEQARVELPIGGLDLSQGFSVDFRASLASSGKFSPIVSATTNPDLFEDGFSIYASNGRLALFLCGADGEAILDGGEITCGEWHGVRAVFGADGTALSIDGEEMARSPMSLDFASLPESFTIGTLVGEETVAPFAGEIADLRIVPVAPESDLAADDGEPGAKPAKDAIRETGSGAGAKTAPMETTAGHANGVVTGSGLQTKIVANGKSPAPVPAAVRRRIRAAPSLKLKVSTPME